MKRILVFCLFSALPLRAEAAEPVATGPTLSLRALAFSPDAKKLAVAEQDRVRIYEIATGKRLEDRPACRITTTVTWSLDGKSIAAGGYSGSGKAQGEIYLWRTGQKPLNWRTGSAMVNGMAFSPNGQVLATATAGDNEACNTPGSARLWKVADGQLWRTLGNYSGNGSDIAFDSDGKSVAYCWTNGSANKYQTVLCDTATGRVRQKWTQSPRTFIFEKGKPLFKAAPLARRVKSGIEYRVEEINGADHMRYRFLVSKPGVKKPLTDVELGYGASSALFGGDYLATVMIENHFPGYESRVDIWKIEGFRARKIRSVAAGSYGLEDEKAGAS
ncbi:hypothetical protein EON80_22480 [bacterium]|nr:MAG: hypothetical protein EON80_22480 [bacterium]